jgi:DNA topoisomerase-2
LQVSDNSREIAMEAAQKDAAQKEAAQKEAAQKDAAQKESSQKYRKMSLLEHIRERPDSYVGSVVEETRDVWIFLEEDPDVVRVVRRQISLCPALYKCIDELIVNAIDQAVVDDEVDVLKIEVRDGAVVVSNNGKGIPVVLHDTEKVYVPELVFGHLLTSSNYDDSVERVVGGRNGYGAKLANVFSKEFRIEVADPTRGLRYTQTFRDGMKVTEPPKITSPKNGVKGGVTVRYVPDLYGLSPDLEALIRRRALDACACTPKHVKVFFNGKKMNVKGAEQYVDAYLGPKKEAPRVSEACDRWHVVVAASSEYKAISFVNGVFTGLGGTHVEHVLAPVAKRVADTLATRGRCAVKPSQVRERLALFVFATIVNPTFSSQTKDALTTKASLFGSAFTRHDALAEKIVAKLDIANDILAQARLKESKSLAKSDGTKTANLRGIPNLEDALKAGTSRSNECTLILTEGLSARTFAISGLSVVGRERYGVFPLKGKLLNLRNASVKQQSGNEEFMNIKKILGLKQGVQYDNLKQLRYGKIMVLADADIDGIHIRGLCLNVIDHFWPELLRLGFVCTMRTPIVKAKRGSEVRSFATLREFDEFKASNDVRTWTCKYYKGLGSSTQQEAKEIFRSMEVVDYAQDHLAAESMVLAFDSAKANQRKEWILKATRDPPREPDGNRVSISDFVHKELVHFSVADVKRSIASVMDGLKPTQRKVLYACFKRNLKNDVKVAQLTGYASEVTHYVHGEASLTSTIVNMAQVRFLAQVRRFLHDIKRMGPNTARERPVMIILCDLSLLHSQCPLSLLSMPQNIRETPSVHNTIGMCSHIMTRRRSILLESKNSDKTASISPYVMRAGFLREREPEPPGAGGAVREPAAGGERRGEPPLHIDQAIKGGPKSLPGRGLCPFDQGRRRRPISRARHIRARDTDGTRERLRGHRHRLQLVRPSSRHHRRHRQSETRPQRLLSEPHDAVVPGLQGIRGNVRRRQELRDKGRNGDPGDPR